MAYKFDIGDIVKINRNATIHDFTKNFWNGCKSDTLKFIGLYGSEEKQDKTFRVIRTHSDGDIEVAGFDYIVNGNIFELVKVKEMTVEQIEKELGYKIKIIKEGQKCVENLNM